VCYTVIYRLTRLSRRTSSSDNHIDNVYMQTTTLDTHTLTHIVGTHMIDTNLANGMLWRRSIRILLQ